MPVNLDDLTKLRVREDLANYLSDTIPSTHDMEYKTGLVLINLIDFFDYNARYYRTQGDQALMTVAGCLKKLKSEDDSMSFIARVNNNHFAIVYENLDKEDLDRKVKAVKGLVEALDIPRNSPTVPPDDKYRHVDTDIVYRLYTSGQDMGMTSERFVSEAVDALDKGSLTPSEPAHRIRFI